jgi:hypothetical protein
MHAFGAFHEALRVKTVRHFFEVIEDGRDKGNNRGYHLRVGISNHYRQD